MITLQYRRADGTFVAMVDGLPYHITETDARFAEAAAAAQAMGDALPFEPEPEPVDPDPLPVGNTRRERACALCVSVNDGVVDDMKGVFNVLGIFRMDMGSYMALLGEPIDVTDELVVVPNNGISVSLSERGEDYFFIEVKDHAGGTLIDPPSFGFTLYSF